MSTSGDANGVSAAHGWFPYPAKFPASAVAPLIEEYSAAGDTVLDPFCGSGTVLLEATRLGRAALGLELNPAAAVVARAKARRYTAHDVERLRLVRHAVASAEEHYDDLIASTASAELPKYHNVALWFRRDMLRELASIRKAFLYPHDRTHIADLLWTAFFRILIPCSNQDNDTRYTAVKKPWLRPGAALEMFRGVLDEFVADIRAEGKPAGVQSDATVLTGDSLELMASVAPCSIDVVVTSPPYINTYDYYLYHKHRLFWYGIDPRTIRKIEVGNHHRIDTMTRERAVREYETYLAHLSTELGRVLRPEGRAIFLIGDGIVKGELVAGDRVLAGAAVSSGLVVDDVRSQSLRSVSKRFIKTSRIDTKRHHIVVLRKGIARRASA